jgi:hypothetical protein
LQYYFERILKLERPFVPSAMALGSSVHSALEVYHRHLQLNEPVPASCVQETFLSAWQTSEDRQSIQFKDKETKDELHCGNTRKARRFGHRLITSISTCGACSIT